MSDSDNVGLIQQWVSQAFNNLKKINVELTSTGVKGGYVGDIAFIKVTLEDENNQKTTKDLVVKYGKTSESSDSLRELIRQCFEREILIYSQAIKEFRKLDQSIIDQFIPTCFHTLLSEKHEVLILQNLKIIGYELHDPFEPLDLDHLILTLENYGKLHAYSFALKQHKREKFHQLFDGLDCGASKWFNHLRSFTLQSQQSLYEILQVNGEKDLLDGLKRVFKDNCVDVFLEVAQMEDSKSVLLHGDCWNNNIMFKYYNNQPVSCKFLDFQVSRVASPIFDLSYHLYATASEIAFQKFEQLLKIYHRSLCQTLKKLGVDDDVFTYDDIVRHWKKYSAYGYILTLLPLFIISSEAKDATDFQETFEKVIDRKNTDKISSRLISNTRHFLKWNPC